MTALCSTRQRLQRFGTATAGIFVLAVAAASALPLRAGSAQTPPLPATLEGEWRCAVSDTQARETAISAFRPRLARLPDFIRGVVERRLTERIHPPSRIVVTVRGSRVRVVNHGARRVTVETPLGGSTQVPDAAGTPRRVTQRLRGGWLEQEFEGERGRVLRLLSTEADGSVLHSDVTVFNDRLGAPVRWRLDYRRVAAASTDASRPSPSRAPGTSSD